MRRSISVFIVFVLNTFPVYSAEYILPVAIRSISHIPLVVLGSLVLSKDLIFNKGGKSVSTTVEQFVKEQAIKKGLNPHLIEVRALTTIGLQPISAGSYTIAISNNYINHLEALLSNIQRSQQQEYELGMYKVLLDHEFNHIKHKDTKKIALVVLIIIGFVEALDILVIKNIPLLQGFIAYMPTMSLFVRSSIMYFLGLVSVLAYSRHLEQRADDYIENDLIYLITMRAFLNKMESLESPRSWLMRLFATHPSFAQRCAKLTERIERLQKITSAGVQNV